MKVKINVEKAIDLLQNIVRTVGTEMIPLSESAGRVLAADVKAAEAVPAFDRSPYDGYALRAEDTRSADRNAPVTLRVLGTLAAGDVFEGEILPGTAVRIMTGAPVPQGADAVVMYEKTVFDERTVTLTFSMKKGENIVRAGEDMQAGELLASAGIRIDPGLSGTMASLGIIHPEVYKKPRVGLITTGSELVPPDTVPGSGMIRDSNRFMLTSALQQDGCDVLDLGSAGDDPDVIADRIRQALVSCDLAVLTGGVSAGDLDLTPQAMERAGCRLLVHGVRMKPGMACCYGICGDKPVLALSGNPAAALTNYLVVVRPAVRKMAGYRPAVPEEIVLTLADPFKKSSKLPRFLRGMLDLSDGTARIRLPKGQGNAVISSAIGCDVIAEVPEDSGPLPAGTKLKGVRIG